MTQNHPIIILGAGCTGLAAAWYLCQKSLPVLLIEAQNHVGGLAGGIRIGEDIYEYGPHVFHTTDKKIFADIRQLMGTELIPYKRTILIKFLGDYFKFPLSMTDVFRKLPLVTVLRAAASFILHFLKGLLEKHGDKNSETVLRHSYGDVLYKLFFKDYITRVWGIPPAKFSPAFARERIPRFNILEWLEALSAAGRRLFEPRGRKIATRGYVEKVEGNLYTTREGFSLITQKMGARLINAGTKLMLGSMVLKIVREASNVTSVVVSKNGQEEKIACRALINTLPINETALSFSPNWSEDVLAAAQKLRFRAIVFVGVKVRRKQVLKASFMYFREHSFNRITDFSHFGFKIKPDGHTILVAEIACDPQDRLWNDEAFVKETLITELVIENILQSSEIVEMHVFRARYAHPMYTLGYEKDLGILLKALGSLENFETAGRCGRFQYVNSHIAMKMGQEAAQSLCSRLRIQ
jgi:protoporphyrinogen oxidase